MHKIGVVVGRFQTPYLTDSHLELFKKVLEENDELLIVIGCNKIFPPSLSELTDAINNPFSYEFREELISYQLQNYADRIHFEFIDDCDTDSEWSKRLDDLVGLIDEDEQYTLYGPRASFINKYCGKLPSKLMEVTGNVSSKNVRNMFLKILD